MTSLSMRENFAKKLSFRTRYIFIFFVLLAAVIGVVSWTTSQGSGQYTHYNNYVIFKHSFFHLIHYQDLYQLFPAENYDLYKYSPSFALWMSAFAWMPDLPGLILFNLLNVIVLILAIRTLPLDRKRLNLLLLFITIETMISLTSSQTNVLITGLLILGWHFMEKDNPWLATLMIVLTFYIKVFGIVGLLICLMYPSRWKAAIATVVWLVVLGLMPLIVVSPTQLLFLYKSWGTLLGQDHGASVGVSLYGWWHTWFGFEMNKQIFVLIGALLLCIPLVRYINWAQPAFRLFILSSILIWVVIFNHKGESPTYILAMAGIAIWYFSQEQRSRLNTILALLALVFTSFSSTDIIFPYKLAVAYVEPYSVKAIFCSVIWVKMIIDLTLYKVAPQEEYLDTDSLRVAN